MKRHKRHLIDRTMQSYFLKFVVPYVLIVCSFFGFLTVVINCYSTDAIILALTSPSGLKEASMDYNLARSLRETLSAHDKEMLIFIVLSVVAIVLGASFLAKKFSHRVAGPVFQIRRALKQVKEGDYSVRVQLRKNDQFKGLAEELNQLIEKLENEGKQPLESINVGLSQTEADVGLGSKHDQPEGPPAGSQDSRESPPYEAR